MGYAFEHEGKIYTPEGYQHGAAVIRGVEAHNAAIEAAELAEWAKKPERWAV